MHDLGDLLQFHEPTIFPQLMGKLVRVPLLFYFLIYNTRILFLFLFILIITHCSMMTL